ncbi:pentapeptide repeats family protein [Pelomyxa schiedti]|nr:pentapeptide repeats family protein [Pelomyxa schiedti]
MAFKQFRPKCGMDFSYVEPLDKNPLLRMVLCTVCKGPWLDPMTHLECGATFCANCIKNNICPGCSQEMSVHQKVPVRVGSMLTLVDNLLVSCPTCNVGIPRRQVVGHWNKCQIVCPQGCGEKVTPISLAGHQDTLCPDTVISCPVCQLKGKRKLISSAEHKDICPIDCANGCSQKVAPKDWAHHNDICPEALMPCPRCAMKVKRGKYVSEHVPVCPIRCMCGEMVAPKDMAAHEASGCKSAPVRCPASALMCPWIGAKNSLDEHEKVCRFFAMRDILQPIMNMITTSGVHLTYNSRGRNLAGQDLSRKIMRGWNLAGADLTGCNLEMADLSNADLSGANMTGANCIQAKLKGANLSGANCAGAILAGCSFKGADLTKCNFNGAVLTGADLSDSKVTGMNVSNSNLVGVKRMGTVAAGTSIEKSIADWPKNCWKEMSGLDLQFADNRLTVKNTSDNTQSTFAETGIPIGAVFTWKVKVVSAECRHAGCGVATPTAQVGRGNHGDKEGCWKWQAGGLTFTNGSSQDTEDRFTGGDVLTLMCDRRKEPTVFTIAKNDKEVKRFQIRYDGELIPFIAACCRGNHLTADFSMKQPLALELTGAIGTETAVLIDPEAVAAAAKAAANASTQPGGGTRRPAGKWAEDSWRHLSGVNANFSDNDLTLTNTTNTTQTTVSKMAIPLGTVRYWSIKVNNSSCDACGFGVVHADKVDSIANTHADSSHCWKWESVGRYYQSGSRIEGGERFRTGDNAGLLCDRRPGKHTLSFYKNGSLLKTVTGLPETSDMVYPSVTPCCTNDSFTTDFDAVPPEEILREIPELTPPPPPPPPATVDINLWPKDTWKRIEGLDLNFENEGLTVINPGKRTQCTISTYGIPVNTQRYWQVMVENTSCSACGIAVVMDNAQFGLNSHADKTNCWKWERIGRFFANGALVSQLAGFVEGDILGVYVDRTPGKGTVTFFKNGEEITTLSGIPEDNTLLAYPAVVPCGSGASFTGLFGVPVPDSILAAQEAALVEAAAKASAAAAASTTTDSSGH